MFKIYRVRWLLAVLVAVAGAAILAGCSTPTVVLRGTITDPTATALVGMQVAVYSSTQQTPVATTVTDASGGYSFTSAQVGAGTYRVRFSDSDWWQGATSWSDATAVALTTTSAVVINESLVPATGGIGGTVSDASLPVGGAQVMASSSVNGATVATVVTGPDGSYALGELPTGSYELRFQAPGKTTRFVGPIVVAADTVTAQVDAVLAPQSSITGQVTDSTRGIAGIQVTAKTTGSLPLVVATATATTDGTFELDGLDDANYVVTVSDPSGSLAPMVWGTFGPATSSTLDIGTLAMHGIDCPGDLSGFAGSGMDFSGKHLANCDLNGANFTGANLSGADFAGSNLSNSILTGATVTGSDLTNTSLVGVRSGGVVGSASVLPAGWRVFNGYLVGPGANLSGSNFAGMDLTGQNLGWVDLSGSSFVGSNLTGVNIVGANFVGADFTGVLSGNITGAAAALPSGFRLIQGFLFGPEANLTPHGSGGTVSVNLSGVDLSGTDLHGANLNYSSFTNCNFTGADLQGASLNAIFSNSNLTDANLSFSVGLTNLSNTPVTGANIDSADFGGINLTKVVSGGLVGTPLRLSPYVRLLNGYLVGPVANLSRANLAGSDLSGMNLNSIDFTGADLTGVNLARTSIDLTIFRCPKWRHYPRARNVFARVVASERVRARTWGEPAGRGFLRAGTCEWQLQRNGLGWRQFYERYVTAGQFHRCRSHVRELHEFPTRSGDVDRHDPDVSVVPQR